MKKLKENKGIIIIILALILASFYWFEYRPSKIKMRCSAEARFDQRANSLIGDEYKKFIDNYYDDCLMRFGLK